MERTTRVWLGIGGVVLLGLVGYALYAAVQPGKYDTFAQCVADSGAVFYGAFWCPDCQQQQAMVKGSAHLFPYVECSTPDGQGQLQVCKDQKVTGYPTWTFADGTRINGIAELQTLSEKTGCTLSQ